MDLVDEHYYNDPSWFLANTERYDSYDREGPHVFLGEYASRGNTWWNGLTEAAYMTGLERNGDLVELASYAPLLANESYVQWSPDAIWFDNDESWSSANYWVQHLFSNNVGDQVVPSTLTTPSVEPKPLDGGVFLSTWATSAAYDNVRVTENDGGDVLFEEDFADASAWSPQTGDWSVVDGEYVQSSTTVTDARSIPTGTYEQDWSNYTLELDARKTAGSEGFLVGFAAGGPSDFFWWNLGGWNNTRQALQKADGGGAGEVKAVEGHSIATGQTYRVKVVVAGPAHRAVPRRGAADVLRRPGARRGRLPGGHPRRGQRRHRRQGRQRLGRHAAHPGGGLRRGDRPDGLGHGDRRAARGDQHQGRTRARSSRSRGSSAGCRRRSRTTSRRTRSRS